MNINFGVNAVSLYDHNMEIHFLLHRGHSMLRSEKNHPVDAVFGDYFCRNYVEQTNCVRQKQNI